ncbi:glutathione S-transferase 1-like [Macrosteles quadrilineatus]|uniref:glutathione S-transferase 1-like n=1 Tax=Macrosteles quadrilineatus TaxID=74068 RepID=UPI0023E0E673|nr:glutathione S-transferase 1-like [Macrosteles quadrilineatus]
MPLTLYFIPPSPPARSVDLVIHALGLTAEYKNVDLREKEQFTPEFLKLNPLHTVPVIDDDGFILWESRAIMAYLVSKYAEDDSLYPKDLQKRAIVDQRLHYSNDVFYLIREIARSLIYFNASEITEEQMQKVKDAQDNIEKLLVGQSFMAGDHLTLADYSYVTLVDVLEVYNPSEEHALTKAWFERCESSMKDFETTNKLGADLLKSFIKEKLDQIKE